MFPFSDSFFDSSLQNESTENFLDLGFAGDNRSLNSFEHEVFNFISDFKGKLSIGYLNINSVHDKFNDVSFILKNQLLDIFIIAESKLGSSNDDEDFTSVYYNLFRRDRTSRGGGLMVFTKKNLTVISIKSDPCFAIDHNFIVKVFWTVWKTRL